MHLKNGRYILLILLAGLLISSGLILAQNKPSRKKDHPVFSTNVYKKPEFVPDSTFLAKQDSIRRADSLFRSDSAALRSKSSLELPAFSTARDSIIEDFANGRRMVYYYGDVTVTYQDMKLTAERMDYDMNTGTVFARGVYDSLAGEWKGRPVMTQGDKTYNMEELRYNFKTRQSKVLNMITNEEEAIVHGKDIKMMPDKSINIVNGKYTVCDAPNPHYYLALTSAKVITQPSRKTVFGPAYLVVEDVVVPVALPFGFVPKRPERASGLLMPTFGEETSRGFYLRDLGMYFVFGDYLDLSVTGDYYTLGSWALDVNSRYKINYKCNGTMSFIYSDDRTGEKGSTDYSQTTNMTIRWTHSQDSKANPGMNFSASVNFSTPSSNKYNSRSVTEALQSQASSSISFSKNWNGKFNLSINALHSQNTRDSSYSFTLPNISFSMSTIYPFKKKNRVGKEKFYEKISFGYNTSIQNKINFKASEFGQAGFGNKFQNGMTHSFSIGLPSFQLFKYITFNPSLSYGQSWHFRTSEPVYDAEKNTVKLVQGDAFNAFGITQTYSGSFSASTRLYGMFNFGSFSKIQAIRHVISPSISMSFSPEQGTYANGYRTFTYTDKSGELKEYEYNIYSGNLSSYPGKGKSATASLSIGNNLEAKVRDFSDTTGNGSKKVKLIDQLSINTGYNFLAEKFKMSTISMSMSTSLFGKVSVSASAAFDPYAVDENGTKINEFAVANGQGLARFTNASTSLSYSISGDGSVKGNDGGSGSGSGAASYYQRIYYHPTTGEYIPGGWLYYTNPNVPWSINFSYSLSFNKSYIASTPNSVTQTFNMSGNVKLSPRLSINASSGFDFKAGQLTTTQLSATYDLHCFNISVSWVPFGTWQSYNFTIAANAAQLADLLKFKKSSSFWDN